MKSYSKFTQVLYEAYFPNGKTVFLQVNKFSWKEKKKNPTI